jgi:peptide-methionine (S)-S-oxide reductase
MSTSRSAFYVLVLALVAGPPAAGRPAAEAKKAHAIFAGGCFWCMEAPFDQLPGVRSSTSGYAGGSVAKPTYEQVARGTTGHAEAVQILYDPKRVTYARLLDVFWRNIDPLDPGGQFCDRGSPYRSAIFYGDEEQRLEAEESKRRVAARLGRPVATEVLPAGPFYTAEEYHQDFYLRNPLRYHQYRIGCGRDERLKALWGREAGGHGGER